MVLTGAMGQDTFKQNRILDVSWARSEIALGRENQTKRTYGMFLPWRQLYPIENPRPNPRALSNSNESFEKFGKMKVIFADRILAWMLIKHLNRADVRQKLPKAHFQKFSIVRSL